MGPSPLGLIRISRAFAVTRIVVSLGRGPLGRHELRIAVQADQGGAEARARS